MKKYAEALIDFNKALSINPDNLDLIIGKGEKKIIFRLLFKEFREI